eukprot:Skav217568  [mRNA]  locus=scaffold1602:704367:710024:+ [translate_table: standard]
MLLQRPVTAPQPSTVLHLDDLLPPPAREPPLPVTRIDVQRVIFLRSQILAADLGPVLDFGLVCRWHPATLAHCLSMPHWVGERPLALSFYTDGSALHHAGTGALAVMMVVHTPYGDRFAGFRCHRLGADATAMIAEQSALCVALLWILQLLETRPEFLAIPISLNFDSMVAGFLAAGHWRPRIVTDLTTISRSLSQWIQERFDTALTWQHVYGHSGHPYNEAVDALAWSVANAWIEPPHWIDLYNQITVDGSLISTWPWLWFVNAADHERPEFPRRVGHFLEVDLASPFAAKPDASQHEMSRLQDADRCQVNCEQVPVLEVTLRVATANVLSLAAHDKGIRTPCGARQQALLALFAEQQTHIVGVQETRSHAAGYIAHPDWHVLSAAATPRAIGGIQVWIAKRWPLPDGHVFLVRDRDLRILHADPQILIVGHSLPGCRFVVVCAHAPSNAADDANSQWWRSLNALIASFRNHGHFFLLIDANARIGSILSPMVGPHAADQESKNGEMLHDLLVQQQLWLPQTFADHHTGPDSTWVHSTQSEARIDFVALDQTLRVPSVRSCRSPVDLSISRTDHWAVQVDLPFPIRAHTPKAARTPFRGQRRRHLPLPPCCPWSMDVHTHAASFQRWLKQISDSLPSQHQMLQPRKTHLSAVTWQCIRLKQYALNRCSQLRSWNRSNFLRAVFHAWRAPASHLSPGTAWQKLLDETLAWHSAVVQKLTVQVKQLVLADDREYYKSLAMAAGRAAADEGQPGLWRTIRALLPKQRRKRLSSIRCQGPHVTALAGHFCDIEAGMHADYAQLVDDCHRRQKQQSLDLPLTLSLEEVPTCIDLEHICSRAKAHRAPGIDQIRIDMVKPLMRFVPQVMYALLFKSWVLCAEPAQYKGGLLFPIAKKPGTMTIQNTRGIMLLPTLGKLAHALLRKAIVKAVAPIRPVTQFGGYAGQQPMFASTLLRSYCRHVATFGVSQAVVFLDVRHAFHSMIRQQFLSESCQWPARLEEVLRREGFDPALLLSGQQERFANLPKKLSPHLIRLLGDVHESTWFTLPGDTATESPCYQTHRGSRPGSPMADLAFNLVMQDLLVELETLLTSDADVIAVHGKVGLTVPVVTWADDIALPLATLSPTQLIPMLQRVMPRIDALFRLYGLTLNYAAGKTETVLQLRGPSAPQIRRALFLTDHGSIDLPHGPQLRAVTKYQHLGVSFGQSFSIDAELQQRIGRASTAYRQLSKTVFANRHLAVTVRLRLLDVLILPVLLYGAGGWPLLTTHQFRRVDALIVKWQRSITKQGFWNANLLTDSAFRARWQLPALSVRLAKLRVLYSLQLYNHAPALLWDVVTAEDATCETSWLNALRHALRWVADEIPDHPLRGSHLEASDILAWLSKTSSADARSIRALVRRSILEEQIVHEAAQGHDRVLAVCRRHQASLTEPDTAASDDARPHRCTACSKCFGSVQALNSHRWKAHQLRCEERQYMATATCQACHRCFWTVQRLQQHLRYSRAKPAGCFAVLQARLDPMPNGQLIASEIPHSLRHLDRLPWMPAHGPHFLPPDTVWERQHQRKLDAVNHSWQDAAFPAHLDDQLYASLAPALTLTTRQWLAQHDATDLDEDVLADRWLACLCHEDPADEAMNAEALVFLTWGQTAMYELLDSLEDPDQIATVEEAFLAFADDLPMWHLLHQREQVLHERAPPPPLPRQPVVHPDTRQILLREPLPCNFRNQQQFLRPWTSPVLLEFPRCDRVPIVADCHGRRHIYILHLFSGHPRDEDCAHWVSSLSSSYFPDFQVHYVPVDTAIHPLLGNLLGPASVPLGTLASKGVFAYGLSGPPCETWTAARHLPPPPGKTKPRPLRDADRLWGLRLLDPSELQQLRVGTALMFKGLEIQTDIVLHGGA